MAEPGDPSAPAPASEGASDGAEAAAGDAVADDGAVGASSAQGFFGDEPPVEAAVAVPAAASAVAVPAAPAPAEGPVPAAPVKASVDDLRVAVGAAPSRQPRISEPPRRRSRRWIAVLVAAVTAGIAALAVAGWLNQREYHLTCGADRLIAAQGRRFPPWGANPLPGPEWKAIPIPPQMECTSRRTDDRGELEAWYVDALGARATALMSGDDVTSAALDGAEALLTQGLLLTRSPDRREQRQRLEQLRADVEYGRASAQIGQAAALLDQAAARFEKAATQRKAADAAGRADQAQRLAAELRAGLKGALPPPCPVGGGAGAAPATTRGPAGPPLPGAPPSVAPGEAPQLPAEALPMDAGVAGGVLL